MESEWETQTKSKPSEELLLRYAAIIEGSDDAIIGKTPGGIITSWNPAAERMFGYGADEAIGESILLIFPPDRVDEEIEVLEKLAKGERVRHFETVRRRKNGELVDVSVSVSPLVDSTGRVIGVSKIVRDITEAKKAEQIIRLQAEEYKLTFDANPLPMWVYDIETLSFLAVNDEAIRHYGFSRNEFLSMTIKDIRPAEDVPALMENVDHAQFEIEHGTWRHRTKDGRIITVEISSHPVSFMGRKAKLVLANDVTARMLAEEALHIAEHRYRTTLDNMMEGCQIIGFDWRYLYLNDVAAAQGRVKKEDLLGNTMMDVYPGIENTEMFSALRRCMEERMPCKIENLFTFDDLTTGWFRLSMEPVQEGVFILSVDITQEKRASEELDRYRGHLEELVKERTAALEEVNRELEAFSYSVSHDLRAPLRHVDGFTKLLAKRTQATVDEESRRYLELISNATREMGTLIDELLAFSKAGRAEMSKSRVSVRSLVDRAILELDNDTHDRTIEWEIGPLPEVEADQQLLYLAVFNLLSNAVKYSANQEKAEIVISHRREGREDVFAVRDNGVGFDMKYAGKLFGVFQRLHNAEDFKGTGIGLANVRRIIARHGGKTWAEGKVNEGAAFYFSLPIVN